MCVWQLLVIITLFSHEDKIPKNPISRQPHISNSNIYKPAEPRMLVISHTLCKFVFVHQNLRDYKLILPFKADNLAKPFFPLCCSMFFCF